MIQLITMKWITVGFLNDFTPDEALILWDGVVSQFEGGISLKSYFMALGIGILHLYKK